MLGCGKTPPPADIYISKTKMLMHSTRCRQHISKTTVCHRSLSYQPVQ